MMDMNERSNMDINEIKEQLKKMLSPKRFLHSVNVMKTSRRLAEKYGEDPDKAALAGLVHDCAKDLDKTEMLEQCGKYGIIVDDIMKESPDLLHGKVGSCLAQELFGIECPRVLSAVSDHTMGCEDMNRLCAIVFVADLIEDARNYPGVETIRKAAEESLEKAIIAGLDSTIEHILDEGGILHPQTVATRNGVLEKLKEKTNRLKNEASLSENNDSKKN